MAQDEKESQEPDGAAENFKKHDGASEVSGKHTEHLAKDKDNDENVDAEAVNEDETADEGAAKAETDSAGTAGSVAAGKHLRFWAWLKAHKIVSISAAVIVVLGVLAAVPFTRYALAGLVIKKDFSVAIIDSQTQKPVTSAAVTLAGKTMVTNGQGVAKIRVPVGSAKLSIAKKYYHDASYNLVVGFSQKQPYAVTLIATGRLVPVSVVNKISGQPVADITISAENSQAITDAKGEATIVIPADKTTVQGSLSGKNYNKVAVSVKVTTSVDPANKFAVTPAGKLYFLSDASGKLDVVKADLDGQNRQTVLAGTGKEDKPSTVLLASRDWNYIALLSKRDGGDNPKLFLIDTSNDQVTTMDEGNAGFKPVGWSGDRFIYLVTRNNVNAWQPKRQALKSYNAPAKSIAVLDETAGEGPGSNNYRSEFYGDEYILDKEIVYTKGWNTFGFTIEGKQATFNSVQADGSQKKVVKSYSAPTVDYNYFSLDTRPADFNEIYIRYIADLNGNAQHDSYQDGKIKTETVSDNDFYSGNYLTYIVSPSDNKTFWTDYRDGKNIFFVGDGSGDNGKNLGAAGTSSDNYAAYGWYTDDYLLVTKNSSEMYIMPAGGLSGGVGSAVKVSDYYKPNYLLRGYGYGYGG